MARPKGTAKYTEKLEIRLTKAEYTAMVHKSLDWGCTRSELIRLLVNHLDSVAFDGRQLSNVL